MRAFVCVCVRVCMCACVHACVCVCVRVFVGSEVTQGGWLGVKRKELTNVDALRVHVCLGVSEGEKMGNCISTLFFLGGGGTALVLLPSLSW